jgi:AcrR family transcriptional regulator
MSAPDALPATVARSNPSESPTRIASKSERTEAAIVDAALELFAERGYEATTMRQIADRAGVSVGNSYYYFASKEALVQALYERFSFATFDVAMRRVEQVDRLADRIAEAMFAWVDTMAPYRRFGAAFFRSATDFGSSVSPFSNESSHIRLHSYKLWRRVVEGAVDTHDLAQMQAETSRNDLDPEAMSDRLPQMLWLYALAIVAIWSQDPTPTSQRTVALIRRSAPLLAQLVKLSANPLFVPVAHDVLGLIDEIASLRAPVVPSEQDT